MGEGQDEGEDQREDDAEEDEGEEPQEEVTLISMPNHLLAGLPSHHTLYFTIHFLSQIINS